MADPVLPADRNAAARAALRSDDFAPLWAAVRRRLERNGVELAGTPVAVDPPQDASRRAIAGLLGMSAAGDRPLRVRLGDLDGLLRRGAAAVGLVEWLEELGGPVADRRAERRSTEAAKRAAWAVVDDHPVLDREPQLRTWAESLRRSGAATRRAGSPVAGAELVRTSLDVVAALPADNVTLPVFAARTTDDPHALDRDTALGAMVNDALAQLDLEEADDGAVWPTAPAYWWRRRWSRVGVICDDLSVSALALNLPARSGGDIVGNAVDEHRLGGVPLRLTLHQLATGEIPIEPAAVFVCENPSVVAMAATRLEGACRPLVCVEGYPNSASLALLDLLTTAGCDLRYHGDFDWDGLRIGASVMGRYDAISWRFDADEYATSARAGGVSLGPRTWTPEIPWSPELPETMADLGVTVFEEQVLDALLDDLGS